MSKKKATVKKSIGQIEVTANVDFLHEETKLNSQEIARMQQDIAGLRYLVGDLATRLAVLESRPTQAPKEPASWWKTYFLGADTDAG